MPKIDADLALAEAALERLDDDRAAEEPQPRSPYAGQEDFTVPEGFTVAEEEQVLSDDVTDHVFDDLAAVVDALCEVFNARDMEGLCELLADDAELPGLAGDRDGCEEAFEYLWERRPTCLMTRGALDGTSVAVLWEVGDSGTWERVAPVYIDVDGDDRIAVAEFDEDASALAAIEAEAPDEELPEGTSWQEWEDGVPPDA